MDTKIVNKLKKSIMASAMCFGLMSFCLFWYFSFEIFGNLYRAFSNGPTWFAEIFFGCIMAFIIAIAVGILTYKLYTKNFFKMLIDKKFIKIAKIGIFEICLGNILTACIVYVCLLVVLIIPVGNVWLSFFSIILTGLITFLAIYRIIIILTGIEKEGFHSL